VSTQGQQKRTKDIHRKTCKTNVDVIGMDTLHTIQMTYSMSTFDLRRTDENYMSR